MQNATEVEQTMRFGTDNCAPFRTIVAAWFASLLLLLFASQATAGDSAEVCRFRRCVIGYGLQVGTTISKLAAEGQTGDVRMGPALGAVAVFGYNSYLGLQGEISYLSKGTRDLREFIDYYERDVSDEVELRYLQIALLGRMGGITTPSDPQNSVLPRIYGGIGIGYLLSDRWNHTGGRLPLPVQDTDISAIIGAGFDIRYGPRSRITIDYRYDFGLREAVGKYKNETSVVTLGLLF